MSSGSFTAQANVQCPFFKFDDIGRNRIVCEGIIDESLVALIFSRREDYNTQMNVFCCEHYPKCEVYRMLMEKYEED